MAYSHPTPDNEMLRLKLVNNRASGAGSLSGVMVLACLMLGWSRPAFSDEPAATADEPSHLQLAPIKFSNFVGGNLGYSYTRTTRGTGTPDLQQALGVGVETGIRAESFLWQPWLALVSSQLTASVNGISANTNTAPTQNSVNTAISGEAALNLLKMSRFPFMARIYRTDGRYEAFYSGTNSAHQNTGYDLSQSYRSRNQRLTGNAAYRSEKTTGSNINPGYSNGFNFSSTLLLTRFQSLALTGSTNNTSTPALGRSFSSDTLMANHAYTPNSIFSVASAANMYKMNYDLTAVGSTAQQSDSNSRQFSSYASLRPEKSPFTVTSSVRFIQSDSSINGITTPALTASHFNLGANYLFSRLIRMYGSVSVADSLGTQTVNTNATLSAARPFSTYSTTNVSGFRYSGSISSSIATNNNTTTNSANQTTTTNTLNLGLYLSHALDKTSELGAGSLSENLHQTISGGVSDRGGSTISNLNSGGSLSWNIREGKVSQLFRLSATDSRNLRGATSVFQMINLQASRRDAMSRNESLHGSLTVQATQAQYGDQHIPLAITPAPRWTIIISAHSKYYT